MLLQIHPGLIIWTLVTFIVLLIVLKAVAWKPLLELLDAREHRIQEALEQAERAQQEAAQAAEENRKQLAKAEAEARQAIAEGRAAAERAAQEVRERAEAQTEQMLEQARRTIQQEKDRALQELRNQVAELAVLAAGKILDENLDDARNRKIVDDFIDRIPESSRN